MKETELGNEKQNNIINLNYNRSNYNFPTNKSTLQN